jgi:hypothetical protein
MSIENTDQTPTLRPPWQPGQSGNPGGRPAVAREFRDRCQDFMSEQGWQRLMRMARGRGSLAFRALELIAAYAYGKPTQLVGSDPDMPLSFTLNIKRDDDDLMLEHGRPREESGRVALPPGSSARRREVDQ